MKTNIFILLTIFFTHLSFTDSFNFNTYNNHGVVGLINMPTARFYNESSFGFTLYSGEPDQKITMTSSPFNWLEASFFYTSIEDKPYCKQDYDPVCAQDYKDKGFNFKLRLKEEGIWPAIAIGINDIAGTGLYSSEYIVASYGVNKTDFHFGLAWGQLNGSKKNFKNPLGKIDDSFYDRPQNYEGEGGKFEPSRYFSGETVSPFFGITHAFNDKYLLKLEYDTTLNPGEVGYELAKQDFSFGLDFNLTKNFTIGISSERGNTASIRFSYKNDPKTAKPRYKYKEPKHKETDSKYVKFIRNLNENGIGVEKIFEGSEQIGVQMTQFTHPNMDIIDEIIKRASNSAGLIKPVKTDLRIADLEVVSEYEEEFTDSAILVYEKKSGKKFFTDTKLTIRPFLASREGFIKGAILLENNSEVILRDNLFFTTNLKYSLADNFDDLTIPPRDTYPAQVRSDVKDYLRNYQNGIFIGRAQLDYHISPKRNHHLMASAGILEEMFIGAGFEYLFFKPDTNYAAGFEIFNVKKRDYQMRFGTLDYENTVGSVNFYYRNYNTIPFDAKISYGEYLAGDVGTTFELSRRFDNGVMFGVFASNTNVSVEQFGEGSFDKGIFFDIPIFGNLVGYSWRPLTKDPGQKLARKHSLYDLLVKFKPIN
mgnify:CR=1 FL=1